MTLQPGNFLYFSGQEIKIAEIKEEQVIIMFLDGTRLIVEYKALRPIELGPNVLERFKIIRRLGDLTHPLHIEERYTINLKGKKIPLIGLHFNLTGDKIWRINDTLNIYYFHELQNAITSMNREVILDLFV